MRIYWHKFLRNHKGLYKRIEKELGKSGFRLVLKFDSKNVCHDAYIEKDLPK